MVTTEEQTSPAIPEAAREVGYAQTEARPIVSHDALAQHLLAWRRGIQRAESGLLALYRATSDRERPYVLGELRELRELAARTARSLVRIGVLHPSSEHAVCDPVTVVVDPVDPEAYAARIAADREGA